MPLGPGPFLISLPHPQEQFPPSFYVFLELSSGFPVLKLCDPFLPAQLGILFLHFAFLVRLRHLLSFAPPV